MSHDIAVHQLQQFKNTVSAEASCPGSLTNSSGCPLGDKLNALTIGARGPMLLEDLQFLDEMAHFTRERIPERVVHAKGGGAFGTFEVTHDITKYCKAGIFSEIGKKTPLVIRFSTVGGESGSADTARDPRGFAVKFYTEQGNWDLVGNNTPIFFINDPSLFPSFIHTQKRSPLTHLKDPDMHFDFISLRPECTHQTAFMYSDRGTPDGFRHMNGYGSHTYKLVNKAGKPVYCKFHFKTNQGIKNLTAERAAELEGKDPDYAIRDLFSAIANGNYPSWTLNIQVMTYDQAEKFRYNPFDLTKIWPQKEFPLIPVGKVTLDRNPKNYFADIEQSAFAPAHMVPGIEPSPDKMLQGRLFAYGDTHRHRLGANFIQIPVNCPYRSRPRNYQRDGPMNTTDNQGGAPNYYPNSFSGPLECKNYLTVTEKHVGDIQRYTNDDTDNYSQVIQFYKKVLTEPERVRLADNLANHLLQTQDFIQERIISNFANVDAALAQGLKDRLVKLKAAKSGSRL